MTVPFKDAHGFYDRYRQDRDSPRADQHPCPHFDWPRIIPRPRNWAGVLCGLEDRPDRSSSTP